MDKNAPLAEHRTPLFFNGLNIVGIYVSGMGDYTTLFHQCQAMDIL